MAQVRHPPGPPVTLGNMRGFILALIVPLLSCSQTPAQNLTLACSGTIEQADADGGGRGQQWMFSLILDTDKMTLAVDDYDPIPLSQDTAFKNAVMFSGPSLPKDKSRPQLAKLNRITGRNPQHGRPLAARSGHRRRASRA
jgi:hypothetical protein